MDRIEMTGLYVSGFLFLLGVSMLLAVGLHLP